MLQVQSGDDFLRLANGELSVYLSVLFSSASSDACGLRDGFIFFDKKVIRTHVFRNFSSPMRAEKHLFMFTGTAWRFGSTSRSPTETGYSSNNHVSDAGLDLKLSSARRT